MSEAISQKGRIIYIEPNNLPSMYCASTPNGALADNIFWNPEDLNIAVDLQVIIPSREYNRAENVDNLNYMGLTNPKFGGYASAFAGEDVTGKNDRFLTDDYTMINYQEILANGSGSKELLGINSINIKFDPHLFPTVDMSFTDVRAASLMMPEEQKGYDIHYGKNASEGTACKSFFQSFFRFPYPRFLLSVKGPYGTYVTFTLTVETFNAKFNSESGNFDVDVHFIGLMYGLYTDIPFNYLFVAPDIGGNAGEPNSYWQSQVDNGTFCYNEYGGDGMPILRFSEFLTRYEGFNKGLLEGFENKGAIGSIEEDRQILRKVKEARSYWNADFYNSFRVGTERDGVEFGRYKVVVFIKGSSVEEHIDYKVFSKKAEELAGKLSISKNELIDKFGKCLKESCKDGQRHGLLLPTGSDGKLVTDLATFRQIDVLKTLTDDEVRMVREYFLNDAISDKEYNGFVYFDGSKLEEYFNDTESEAKQDYEANKIEANEQLGSLFKENFGFTPSIENVFRMIFAHLDTFLHQFYETIEAISTSRKIKDYGLKMEETDVASNAGTNAFLPPFTGFYRKSPDTGLMERFNPAEHPLLKTIPEVNFITRVFTGVDNLENIEVPYNLNPNDDTSSGSVNVGPYTYKATSLYDFFTDGQNPYSKLQSGTTLGEDIYKLFCYRAYYACLANPDVAKDDILDSYTSREYENYKASVASSYRLNEPIERTYRSGLVSINNNKIYPITALHTDWNDDIVNLRERTDYYTNGSDPYPKITNFEKSGANIGEYYWDGVINRIDYEGVANLTTRKQTTSGSYGNPYYSQTTSYDCGCAVPCPLDYYTVNAATLKKGKPYSYLVSTETLWFPSLRWNGSLGQKDVLSSNGSITKAFANTGYTEDNRKYVVAYYLLKCFDTGYKISEKKSSLSEVPYVTAALWSARFEKWTEGMTIPNDIKKDLKKGTYIEDSRIFKGFVINDAFKKIYAQLKNLAGKKIFDGDYYKYDLVKALQESLVTLWKRTAWLNWPKLPPATPPDRIMQKMVSSFADKMNKDLNNGAMPEQEEPPTLDDTLFELTQNGKMLESTYYTMKNLYDRWISTYPKNIFKLKSVSASIEAKTRRLKATDSVGYADKNFSEFDNFLFIDGFFNDISTDFYVNVDSLFGLLLAQKEGKSNFSVLEFISALCRENKLLFKGLPTFNNFYNVNTIAEMFKPHNPYEVGSTMRRGAGNTYMIMYTYEPANKLGFGNEPDKLGVGYANDGVTIADGLGHITEEAVRLFKTGNGLNADITAFGVTPGKQNQSYFTSVQIGMDNPRVTDISIQNKFNIAAAHKNGGTIQGVGTGQNLFSIYSNRSYDCSVEMLGCANIMPLMYFQLNNVPMFRGVYRIMQVEHNIQNNTMKTKFVGTKVSKYAIPFNKEVFNIETLQMVLDMVGETNFFTNIWNMANITVSGNKTEGFIVYNEDGSVLIPLPEKSTYDGKVFYLKSARAQMNVPMSFFGKPRRAAWTNDDKTYGAKDKWMGVCASFVKSFISAGLYGAGTQQQVTQGGAKLFPHGMGDGYEASFNLPKAGYRVVGEMHKGVENFAPFEPGDIMTMQHPTRGTKKGNGETYGHVAMYTAEGIWVSDCNQGTEWCSFSSDKHNAKAVAFQFRFSGSFDGTTEKKFGE